MKETMEIEAGERIDEAATKMLARIKGEGDQVVADFNEIELVAKFGMTVEQIVNAYHKESEQRHKEYLASEEYKVAQAKAGEEDRVRKEKLKIALASAPLEPTFIDKAAWDLTVKANKDPYGAGVVRYAHKWMRLMEGQINSGVALKDCAKEMSHLANDEGITGFMYGCAVGIISQVWKYGDDLRRWHNLDTQIGDEGEKANESGGVLNPALLTINTE